MEVQGGIHITICLPISLQHWVSFPSRIVMEAECKRALVYLLVSGCHWGRGLVCGGAWPEMTAASLSLISWRRVNVSVPALAHVLSPFLCPLFGQSGSRP